MKQKINCGGSIHHSNLNLLMYAKGATNMLYVLRDIDTQDIYGIFDSMEAATREKHKLAALDLNFYLRNGAELRQAILDSSTKKEQKQYFDRIITITETSGYEEYLELWKDAFSITEIELNKLKVGEYLCK